jgi:hypothetical protein
LTQIVGCVTVLCMNDDLLIELLLASLFVVYLAMAWEFVGPLVRLFL